ncbi:type IV toxin-antitoxin system AbiEi family antitoxin domain-containing protein [Metallibacterium scheffleri]|uniref:type IV toxin-antitoxin system AbiEi family antitoxin domain-containing protein n=1 Tax=Metallibacterium scheffleri TaxID=993689 RepID=UPI001B38677E|nr:type IV toxin-antitoxin system AbiEi family antitoxin [Metallibacterium scheffleri]
MSEILPANRARLAVVLRATNDVVSIETAAQALDLDRNAAAKLMSRWAGQGWMRRIGQGLYVPVPIDLATSDQIVSDPWVLVPSLFGESYIGGWTAAHHWDLTEQLFNETMIFAIRRIDEQRVTAQGVTFLAHHIAPKRFFGVKPVWRGTTRVNLSDPARTLIDMLALPQTGGGIDHVADCLSAFRKLRNADLELLIAYAEKFGNGAIFKRLGFLAEAQLQDEKLAAACRTRLTKGYTKLDPGLDCSHLVTAWNLWVPARWKERLA